MVHLPWNTQQKLNEDIFRSAPMTLVQFYVTTELARDIVFVLGQLGDVHFRDLNSKLTPFQRPYINELKSIDQLESHLQHLKDMMLQFNITLPQSYIVENFHLNSASEMDNIKIEIYKVHEKISHLGKSFDSLIHQQQEYLENRVVLNTVNDFHSSQLVSDYEDLNLSTGIDDELESDIALLNSRNLHLEEQVIDSGDLEGYGFNSIAGTLAREKIPLLRNILWRALRGNLYFHDIPMPDETFSGLDNFRPDITEKNIFIIYVHGEFLKKRLRKIVESLNGTIYDNVIRNSAARHEVLKELNQKIEDLSHVIRNTNDHLISELIIFQESYVDMHRCIKTEKLIYETLNKFDTDFTRRCLIGEGWIPSAELDDIKYALKELVRLKSGGELQDTSDSHETISLNSIQRESVDHHRNSDSFFAIDDDGTEHENDDGSLIAVVNELSTNRTPPTYHRTNKFTSAFQLIIDAYGIATYQEVNPGLATIVTFPFMFAIMFGDLGHGFIVFLISLYLIFNEKRFSAIRNKDEIFEMAFNGRYIILLMGLFSVYTGLIYNDIFSKSMTLFNSGWKWEFPKNYDPSKDGRITLAATRKPGKTYIIGLDWAWHGAENGLIFTNSYKMKLSILMGYVHMTYSLFFSLVNYRHFKSRVDIIGNFIPGVLFMQSIFGYLSLTIVYKWCVDWIGKNKRPPGLLNMLINMFLAPGKIDEELYRGQQVVQIILVLIALICVPWLLLYKPMVLRRQNNKAIELGYSDIHHQREHEVQQHEEEEAINLESELPRDSLNEFDMMEEDYRFPNDMEPLFHNSGSHGGEHEDFNFGDIVIHQVIHTIEFCLNCVSHTASYLRLWALSLAHSQLSTVLWTMTIQNAFGITGSWGIFMIVVTYALWFSLTVCILILMEGTSAMLHSLRLHWVEAMSKFFEGEGYKFEPFSFNSIDDD